MAPRKIVGHSAAIGIAILFTAFSLSHYAVLLRQYITIQYSFYFELGMVGGQLLFQALFLLKKPVSLIYRYWLQLLTVSFTGSVLLCLFLGIHRLLPVAPVVALGYFFCVVLFMFLMHRRRVQQLQLPAYLSYTWLLYRSLILIYIL